MQNNLFRLMDISVSPERRNICCIDAREEALLAFMPCDVMWGLLLPLLLVQDQIRMLVPTLLLLL